MKTVFLYHNPRERLLADVEAGTAPDTGLLGSNHLAEFGIEASVEAPRMQVKHRKGRLLHRMLWNVRGIPVAWELDADVVCSFWTRLYPLIARMRGKPAVVAFNVQLCTTYLRASRPRRRLMGAALRSAQAVVCFASAQREQLLRQHALDPDRVHMVPFGVDERFYSPRPAPANGYVLAVGRDMARDYRTFAGALDGLDARAIIVASERNLADVKVPGNVELRLDVSYPELRELYAGAACVVDHPTRGLPLRRRLLRADRSRRRHGDGPSGRGIGTVHAVGLRARLGDCPDRARGGPRGYAGGNRSAARRPRTGREAWCRRTGRDRTRVDDAAHGAAPGPNHHGCSTLGEVGIPRKNRSVPSRTRPSARFLATVRWSLRCASRSSGTSIMKRSSGSVGARTSGRSCSSNSRSTMLVWTKVRRRKDSLRNRRRWFAYDSPNATQSGRGP